MAQIIMDHGVSRCFGTSLAPNPEGARFENPNVPETIGLNRISSAQSQSLPEK